jgi:hypothetical protein
MMTPSRINPISWPEWLSEDLRLHVQHAWAIAHYKVERARAGPGGRNESGKRTNWSFGELAECGLAPVLQLVTGVRLLIEQTGLDRSIDFSMVQAAREQVLRKYLQETYVSTHGVPVPFDFARDEEGNVQPQLPRVIAPALVSELATSSLRLAIEGEMRAVEQMLNHQAISSVELVADAVAEPAAGAPSPPSTAAAESLKVDPVVHQDEDPSSLGQGARQSRTSSGLPVAETAPALRDGSCPSASPRLGRPRTAQLSENERTELSKRRHVLIDPIWADRHYRNCNEWAEERKPKHWRRVSGRALDDWLSARIPKSNRQTLHWIAESVGISVNELP